MRAQSSAKNPAPTPLSGVPSLRAAILIVDDHPIVREGLVRVIDQTPDLSVCGQAENVAQALAVLEKAKPAIVIVDISLGGQNGIELIKDIRVREPDLPMLVHSMYDEAMYAERCLRAGAKGYVMKQEPPTKLLEAVRQVLKGDVYLSEAMTKQMLARMSGGQANKGTSPAELLSDRELEVFELLGRGFRTKEIASQLHLSDKTIQTYREHIKEKLQIKDAVSLVRHAVQMGGIAAVTRLAKPLRRRIPSNTPFLESSESPDDPATDCRSPPGAKHAARRMPRKESHR